MMTPHDIAIGLERLGRDSQVIYNNYAEAKARYENLVEHKKVLLGESIKKSESKSVAQKEYDAYASKEYKDYIDLLSQANTDYLKAYAQVKGLDIRLACYQSLNKITIKELEINSNVQ